MILTLQKARKYATFQHLILFSTDAICSKNVQILIAIDFLRLRPQIAESNITIQPVKMQPHK